MMTFKQFVKHELRSSTFSTLSTFIYGIVPWALVVLLSILVTTPTESFYKAQAGILIILVIVCSISTYDSLRRRYQIYVLEEKIAREEIRRSEDKLFARVEHWDGRH
jgi:ABC-type transport system involved in cytochrome bd biosynthesis fused ATPase/permease subunit